jgi:hypothetical protein
MKRSLVLVCSLALALVATASLALPASDAPVTLATIFAPPAPSQSSAPGEEIVFAATMTKSTCIASCGSTTVSCSYTAPSTCTAVDRNCPSTQGYVTCNGVTTYCSQTCTTTTICQDGATRYAPWTGDCCADGRRLRKHQQCVNNQWVDTGNAPFCGISCDGRDPIDPLDPQQ